MTYIFRPGAYNVTAAERATITQPGGAALPWWNPDGVTPAANCGAWQAKGAASLAASYLNLATLGNANIDPAVVGGVAPGWAAGTGWDFTGTQWLQTNIIPASGYSMLVQFSNVGGGLFYYYIGQFTFPTARFQMYPKNSGSHYYESGGFVGVAGDILSGNMAVAGQQGYLNGAPDGGAIPAWVGVAIRDIYIGKSNGLGAPFAVWKVQAVAIYNVTLTAPQVLVRATAMAAL